MSSSPTTVTLARLARLLLFVAAAAGSRAQAEVVVLSQAAVPQYGEVAAGFREIRGAPVVDVADEAAVRAAMARGPAVVVAVGSKALDVARTAAGAATVVPAAVLGLRASSPGIGMEARAADAVQALHALAPRAVKVAVLHAGGEAGAVADAKAAARAAGLQAEFIALPELTGFQAAFERAVAGRDAVWILPDPRIAQPELVRTMVMTCLRHRVVLVGFLDGMTRTGALISVAADLREIGREAARLANELERLPRERRADVPLRFARGRLTVNARTRELLAPASDLPPNAEVIR